MTIMFGIPNCDTIKKAKVFLNDNNVKYDFHDYRKDGVTSELIEQFFEKLGWENVLNKRGTTYRNLTADEKLNLDRISAKEHLLNSPAMIKRPILLYNNEYYLGFKPAQYNEIIK